jgi:hypothetical protein
VQAASDTGFTSLGVNDSTLATNDTIKAIGPLSYNSTYYWRVSAKNAGGTSAWSAVWNFSTVRRLLIPINIGWNMISLNLHPQDSTAAAILGPLKGFILAKNDQGQVYCPSLFIDDIGVLRTGEGYQVYADSVDTIRVEGTTVDVAATPLSLPSGWSIIGYLPQSNISITTALAGITSQILIVKNNAGQVYLPDYFIDDIGTMKVGEGYQIFMKSAAVLTYPVSSPTPKLCADAHAMIRLPEPKHYLFKMNTGNNATIASSRVTLGGQLVPDSSEIGAFDSKGKLVGVGTVIHGSTAFSVWGDNTQTNEKDGCGPSEKIAFKLWNGKQEYPLDIQSETEPRYSANGIIIGSFSVPDRFFITRFALDKVYPNPFRRSVKIAFDVPMIEGIAKHAVEINIFDMKGSLVHRLTSGKYGAGHYILSWNGENESGNKRLSASNVYIVQMKANNFNKRLKLVRIK